MIYIRLRGRVGNQLFIYAIAQNLSIKTGQKVKICTKWNNRKDIQFRNELNQFNLSKDISFDDDFQFPWYADNDFGIIKILRKLFPNFTFSILKCINVFLWLGEEYKPIEINKNKDVFLDGFWQSEKYFRENYNIIFNNFFRINQLSDYNQYLIKEIKNSESVCITIRRGDYCQNKKIKKEYYICDEDYFKKSMKKMLELKPNARFFVFSDDIEWAKEELCFPKNTMFEKGNDDVSIKLYMMKLCKNFILSNSSFSWWAQELSPNKNKLVISPQYWYKDKRSCDMIQDNWIKI